MRVVVYFHEFGGLKKEDKKFGVMNYEHKSRKDAKIKTKTLRKLCVPITIGIAP